MPAPSDYYAVLQVSPDAEPEVIDAAYKKLAAKYHPDVSRDPRATERMVRINAAYEVLSTPALRAAYDASRRVSASALDTAPRAQHQSLATAPGSEGARRMRVERLLWVLAVLGLLALAGRAFRLGPRELAVVAGVALLLLLLTTRGAKKR